jgi:hypothetical protein
MCSSTKTTTTSSGPICSIAWETVLALTPAPGGLRTGTFSAETAAAKADASRPGPLDEAVWSGASAPPWSA